MTDPTTPLFGFNQADLRAQPTVYAPDLFKGQVVIVTGGGGGLGLAIATLFARLGATLAICGRNEDKLETGAAFLRTFGGEVITGQMTIRDPEQCADFVEEVHEKFGRLDVLVNKDGKVLDLKVYRSSGYALLDRAATSSVKHWLFEPGMIGEEKVNMWVRVPIRFELKE